MVISRRLARPMLSAVFIAGGLDAMRNPEGKVKVAEPVAEPLARHVPGLPTDTENLVRLNGAVMVGSAALLAVGKFRRLAALALIGSIVPTTYAGHRFWEETDEVTRAEQRIHFLKNLGLLGGLLLAAMDTEGEPSLGWRAKRRLAPARRTVASTPRRARTKQARQAMQRANLQWPTFPLAEAERVAARAARRGKAVALPAMSMGAQRAGDVLASVADHLPGS